MFYQYYKSPLFSTIAHDKHLQIAFHCSRIITAVLVFFPLSLSLFPSPSPATVIGTSNHFLASQNQWLGEKNFAALRSIQRSKLPICFIILYDYQCICMCMNLCSRIYTYLYYKLLQYIIIFAPTPSDSAAFTPAQSTPQSLGGPRSRTYTVNVVQCQAGSKSWMFESVSQIF